MKKRNYLPLIMAITCLLYAALLLGLCFMVASCAPAIYKVTFESGDYDYYELRYRPAADAKSIEYNGETILGVEKIEKLQ